ncbi:sulfite exporter TauE/SafE (macronuclear) [Tetrahymena thermophila SB210]|uniref:Sulfite exporter TauE/SafE n=1 Tax=Tetrahymena thermophila (strain SB210) TaxID=312017 RepID=I7M0G7_TETTS|nr:sulfite exporter TauE/SafE [Tetrahymena thermophila SB210]EAR87541.1 sulfite exporter TauE/SafE [Tetrahymena thermophila SB210]|eukprot:XP_001007786.1 sulfite exporter TauE/SafE [Tetrahymena thermophila SB210]
MSTISCTTDSDCDFNFYCSSDLTCVHDSLWPPSVLDVITYLLIPVVVGIGNVGGLGGGIVKVPMLMLMLNYQTKVATFISYCILFGSCLANSTLLIFKKHPLLDKPIIDYNIVLMINPMVLLGTNIGIFLNILLPEIAAGILFICFLILISPYMFKKGLNLYRLKKEQQKCQLSEQLLENDQENEENEENNGKAGFSLQEIEKNVNNYQKINQDINKNPKEQQDAFSFKKLQNTKDVQEVESIMPQNPRAQFNNKQQHSQASDSSKVLSKSQLIEEEVARERTNSYFQAEEANQDHLKRQSILISQNAIKESEVGQNKIFVDATGSEELEAFYQEEYKQVPTKKLILLIVVFFSVQMLVFIRGGKGLSSFVGITTCSTAYWVTNGGIVLLAFVAAFVIRFFLQKWEKNKRIFIEKYHLEDEFASDLDVNNNMNYIKISLAGLTAGMLAGTFGVGAGLALVPILLASGVHPQVAAATCGFNYFFISTTTIIQVFTNDYLNISQIILFSILSFIGGFLCAKLIYRYVEKKKASYLIVFIVFGLAILNILAFIVYLTKKGVRYGWDSLVNQTPFCEVQ